MGGGYSAWVDNGLAGEKPPEELKTACKFRPWNAYLKFWTPDLYVEAKACLWLLWLSSMDLS